MSKLLLCLFSLLLVCESMFAQLKDSTILLPNRLSITSLKNPKRNSLIDSVGQISIECVNKTDSIISIQKRELTGKLVYFTDSSLTLHVESESILTYRLDRTSSHYYYYQKYDSLKNHYDTLLFSEIHSFRYNEGKFRQVTGLLQSPVYSFAVGCFGILITLIIAPKKTNLSKTENAIIHTSIASISGISSLFFYPKLYVVNKQLKKRKQPNWKIEVL